MPDASSNPPRARGRLALAALAVSVGAFALYFLSTGPDPFPGPPSAGLLEHLGLDPLHPAVLDPLWGAVVRAADLEQAVRAIPSSITPALLAQYDKAKGRGPVEEKLRLGSMMLDIEAAVDRALSDGCRTNDIAGPGDTVLSCAEMTRAILDRI